MSWIRARISDAAWVVGCLAVLAYLWAVGDEPPT